MLERHLQQLASEMEVQSTFGTATQGVYALPLDEKLVINIIESPPGFSFQCNVAPCPDQGEEGFYTEMLAGNLFGKGTLGSVLGLSDDGKTITLTMEVESNVDYKEFRDRLEDFINTVEFWRSEAEQVKR